MRYQTSSMRKNAKPTTAAAASTNRGGAASGRSPAFGPSAGDSGGGRDRRLSAPASPATPRFTAAASHKVARVPNASQSQKVAARQPAKAPREVTPYRIAAARRR